MKTFVEIHALQNFAPSNLNRDDTGAPKDAFFGGTRRSRVSSQCIKKAVRTYFKSLVADGAFGKDDLADRSKRLFGKLTESLVGFGRNQEEAMAKVKAALASIQLTVKDDGKTQYLIFAGQREVKRIAETINAHWEAISLLESTPEEAKPAKSKKEGAKEFNAALREPLLSAFDGGKAIDIALFGRMLADMPEKNQDAACQVAHAISTHAVEREFDFYTAVDDLKPEDTTGADMMGTVEFNSACFYRYAVIDWEKLVANLQGDKALALKGLAAFVKSFAIAEPTGKQNTFAAHNPPEFIAISVRNEGSPINYANAFEAAVSVKKGESLSRESANRMIERAKVLRSAYGNEGKTYVLNLLSADTTGFGVEVTSLAEMVDKTCDGL